MFCKNIPMLDVLNGCSRLRPRPPLTKLQKKLRMEFTKKHVSFGSRQKDVVFSDEKKNDLEAPADLGCKKTNHFLSKRQCGSGSVMVWTGFAAPMRQRQLCPFEVT